MSALSKQDQLAIGAEVGAADRFRRAYALLEQEARPDRVRTGRIFLLARDCLKASAGDIEQLLEDPRHGVRVGAVSIMDFQARSRSTSGEQRERLFGLYLRRHDRIDNWDLVDRAAPHVIGRHLADRPRDVLYELARSANQWERRTAVVSTWYFIRGNDVDDTFRIAQILAHDPEHFVQTAVGSWVREAGKRAPDLLLRFLDRNAATMPRTALRYAVEKLDPSVRKYYLELKAR